MKRYNGYKDSETEWFGEIPKNWSRMSFRFGIKVLTDYTANGSFASLAENVTYLESGFSRLVRLTDLREGLTNEGIYVDEKAHCFLKKSELFGGELLLANVGAYAGYITIMPILEKKMTLGPNMFLIRPNENFDGKFIYYLLSSANCAEQLRLVAISSAQPKLNKENIRQVQILAPSLSEQTQIAQYLDHKTSQIDKLITDKEKLIELLSEESTAIINQAVTKGLNPEVPMKDSGIEWLGEVPEHWEVVPIKRLIEVRDGTHDTPDYVNDVEKSYPLITSKDFEDDRINFSNAKMISEEDYIDIGKRSSVKSGDVLMSMIGGNIGKSLIVGDKDDFSIKNLALFMTRGNPLMAKYLKYYFESGLLNRQIELKSRGGAQGFLSLADIRNLVFFKFDTKELESILEFLDRKIFEIGKVTTKIQQEIQLLKEYKTALISEVVTGKVDVRDEVIAESTELVS